MAAHSRKSSMKRVAAEDDTPYPTPGIKKVKIVSPDYRTKHPIGRRKTKVTTYNERILQYQIMAKACKESATKGKISKKRSKEQSVKISGNNFAVKKCSVASSTLKFETGIPIAGPPRSISMLSTSEANVSLASALTKKPVTSTLTKKPVASTLTKTPVASTLTKTPVASTLTKTPVASTLTKTPVASTLTKTPVASTLTKTPVASTSAKKPVASGAVKGPVAGTYAKRSIAGTYAKKPVAGIYAKKVMAVAGTPAKKVMAVAGTPAKKVMAVAGTPAKKVMAVAGTPTKKVMAVTGTPAKKVMAVTGTPAKKATVANTSAKVTAASTSTKDGAARKTAVASSSVTRKTAVASSSVARKTAVASTSAARKTSVESLSTAGISGLPLPRKSPINHCLKETSTKTGKKKTSNHNLEESPDTSLPSISNSNRCNLLQANQCRELSVHLVRLRREASLNAAAKVNLIYNENQSKASGKQAHTSRSGNQHKMKNARLVKKCKFKVYKVIEHSLFSKVSKSKKSDYSISSISKTNKLFKLKVNRSCNKGTCLKKSKLANKVKAITTMQNKLNEQIQNSSTLCHLPVKQTLQNKTKLKSNNSNEGFTNKSKQLNGYECRKDCIACHIEAKDYGVDCVDKTNRNYRNENLCSFNVSCLEGYSIDNSALREKNPDCFQLAHNKQKHYSSEKKLLGKCVKVCQSKDLEVDYSNPKDQLESYLTDYGGLKGYRPDKLSATNNDPLTVTAQNTYPNSYQNLKNAIKNHKLHFDNSPTAIHLPSNLYGSKGPHQYRNDKKHCCTATPLDFCQAKYNNQTLEESPGKLSKRMASLNAQAIMDVCQEPRPSKREFLQNSQRAARTHYIFSPKRQSCRWVDGLGMFLTSDLQNPSTNDLKQKIIVSCTATSTNSSSVIGSNISSSKSSLITSGNNCSSDIQVQAEIHERLKEKSDKTFKATPKKSTPAQFSQFNNVLSSQGRPEMVSGCSSFPYIHGENVSPTQCQTFTLNGIGSISNLRSLPYQPYRSPFSVPCNLGSIPHCSYYPSDSCYPHSSTMVQPIPKSCVITSPIPIHVPHAEVKVLIHNPHPSQPFIQTADSPKLKKSRRGSQQTIPKTKTVDNQQKNNSKRKTDIFKSKPKLGKRNCDLNIISEKVEKSYSPSKRKKPNSSNCGWSWEGEPEMKPVLSLNIDDPPSERKCYPAIKHTDGELIRVRDCVLLRSGPRKKDLPYTAKVVAFWENTTDGEMMMSLLWYYRPEHTESGRQPHNIDCEVFASKHRDINSVACIEEKCYVLTFNEYCRYKAEVRRSESNFPARRKVVPASENYPRQNRLPPIDAAPETVFLCRKVYHFRQKRILKN